jgi:hypothetical protein
LVCYKAHADIRPGGNIRFFLMSENVTADDGSTNSVHNGMSFSTLREYCIPSSLR